MTQYNYMNVLPAFLTTEQKHALVWKIEGDYRRASVSALVKKDDYVKLAIKFYTRGAFGMEDIVEQYRNHRLTQSRQNAFIANTTSNSLAITNAS